MLFEGFFTESTRLVVEKIVYVVIITVIASIIAKTIATAVSRFGQKTGIPRDILGSVNRIITYFIAFVGLVLVLDIFNFNIATFVASFGIVGLIIGIGSQAVISNFIAGILIMLEKPFVTGDFIDIIGFQGVVRDIRVRSTSVQTSDGRLITIPNSTFTSNAVVNYSKTGEILVKIPVSLAADVDLEKVSEIMTSAAKSTRGVRPYRIEVLATGMKQVGPSWNIEIELRFWVNRILERDTIVSSVTARIKDELAKEKIITVPSRQ
ncbi:small-conductance mechanosensitive channel [Candidatus Methanoperedens nitroreducens]|uniref:Small-conductance mechanosensitive channel n=1 Tax=Candidatus Methanoperedens nitratireducens TaxID=1392998 RepID=A0A062UW17_9EURY|nr:mechanosensitive ion channel domain-containing protein [Candidatus Methanoperedens nitroreducens]KCZ71216.1 small-conductance mechanosensitive channel [Candidatus Methanoperedens nitroreducens]MDJ1421402.1 mechanosensitive ion channel [Candidatus Methanoperedens sp.]